VETVVDEDDESDTESSIHHDDAIPCVWPTDDTDTVGTDPTTGSDEDLIHADIVDFDQYPADLDERGAPYFEPIDLDPPSQYDPDDDSVGPDPEPEDPFADFDQLTPDEQSHLLRALRTQHEVLAQE
jgi:hypothetical protein